MRLVPMGVTSVLRAARTRGAVVLLVTASVALGVVLANSGTPASAGTVVAHGISSPPGMALSSPPPTAPRSAATPVTPT